MKRFLAFYGDCYYPRGGMGDFLGGFDSKEEAIKAIADKHQSEDWSDQWAHIYDLELRSEVWTESDAF